MDHSFSCVNYAKIGKVIRTERQKKNLTQDELGVKVGCCGNYISHIEANGHAGFETLVRIAEVLGFSLNAYLEDPDNIEPLGFYWNVLLSSLDIEKQMFLSQELIRSIGQFCPEIMISNAYFHRLQQLSLNRGHFHAAEDPQTYGNSPVRKRITHPRKKKG